MMLMNKDFGHTNRGISTHPTDCQLRTSEYKRLLHRGTAQAESANILLPAVKVHWVCRDLNKHAEQPGQVTLINTL